MTTRYSDGNMTLERVEDPEEYVQYWVIGPNVRYTCPELGMPVGPSYDHTDGKEFVSCISQISDAVKTDGVDYCSRYDNIKVIDSTIRLIIENMDIQSYCYIEFNGEDSLSLARLLDGAVDMESVRLPAE